MARPWEVERPVLLDFESPPDRRKALGSLTAGVGGRDVGVDPFRVWVNAPRTVGWVASWERVLCLVGGRVARFGRGVGGEGVFGWGARKGFGVRMPPDFIFVGGWAVWELSGGEDGYLLVCPRVVPREDEGDG